MKMYRVFISSTYSDLKDERAMAMEAAIKANCFPAGMELFSATDRPPIDKIHEEIDNCDIYLLIIAARYGSIRDADVGLSYTEEEFDYAVEKGKHILVFPIENPGEIYKKTDVPKETIEKIDNFIEKAKDNRTCSFWKDKDDLKLKIALALYEIQTRSLLPGWVKESEINDKDLMKKHIELTERYDSLKQEFDKKQEECTVCDDLDISTLSQGDDLFEATTDFTIEDNYENERYSSKVFVSISWNEILDQMYLLLKKPTKDDKFRSKLSHILIENGLNSIPKQHEPEDYLWHGDQYHYRLEDFDKLYLSITNQLTILGYITEMSDQYGETIWFITEKYTKHIKVHLAIKKQ